MFMPTKTKRKVAVGDTSRTDKGESSKPLTLDPLMNSLLLRCFCFWSSRGSNDASVRDV